VRVVRHGAAAGLTVLQQVRRADQPARRDQMTDYAEELATEYWLGLPVRQELLVYAPLLRVRLSSRSIWIAWCSSTIT
jgi:hypothetical protein